MTNVLSVISVCGRTGGTTVKLKKLIEESHHNHCVYFALYDDDIIKDYPDNKKWFESSGKMKVYQGFYGRNFLKYALDVSRVAKENKIDVIHFYFNFENTFAPILKILYPKATLVRSIVGYDEPLSFIRSFALKNVLNSIDHVIYISNYIKNLYTSDYPNLKNTDSSIIYNTPIHISEQRTLPSIRNNLVSVSGLCTRKNLEVLIKGMAMAVNKYKINNKLYIIGDGHLRNDLQNLINKLGIEEYIKLVGYSNDIVSYLNDCLIYVHPANTEGFGIAVAEAMYMECPVIASDAGALPELVMDNYNGFIVDPYNHEEWAESINKLLQDPDLRLKMAKNSQVRAHEMFPLSGFVNNHDNLYDKFSK